MKNSLIISLFLLFSLWGCSKGGSKVTVGFSNTFALSALPGGAMLYLESIVDGKVAKVSSVAFTGEDHKVSLPSGSWRFTLVGWDGPGNLKGTKYCGSTLADLAGTDKTIDLSVSQAGCNSDEFSPTAFRAGSAANLLALNSCTDLSGISSNSSECSSFTGNSGSLRVRLASFSDADLSAILLSALGEGMASSCIKIDASNTTLGNTTTNLNIPYGRYDGLFATVVESYTDTNCKTGKRNFFFPKGLAGTTQTNVKVYAGVSTDPTKVFFVHGGLALSGAVNMSYNIFPNGAQSAVVVKNNSGEDITIVSAFFPKTGPIRYNQDGTGPDEDFPGHDGDCMLGDPVLDSEECEIKVQFAPTVAGAFTKTLSLKYFTASDPDTILSLSAPVSGASVTPASLSIKAASTFGNLKFGDAKKRIKYTLKNNGGYPADVSNIMLTGSPLFLIVNDFCQFEDILPGKSCSFSVEFDPSGAGYKPGNIHVDFHNGVATIPLDHAISATVEAVGNVAFDPTFTVPGMIALGAGSSSGISLTNNSPIAISDLSISNFGNGFSLAAGGSCGTGLGDGASCNFNLGFAPTAARQYTRNLNIKYSYMVGVKKFNVTKIMNVVGTGLRPSLLSSSSNAQTAETIVNSSGTDFTMTISHEAQRTEATLLAPTLTGTGFTFKGGSYPGSSGGTCGSELTAGSTCDIVLHYQPTAMTQDSGNLRLTYFDGVTSKYIDVTLVGNVKQGAKLTITTADNNYSFGNMTIGQNSSMTFIVKNIGTHSATISAPSLTPGLTQSSWMCGTSIAIDEECTLQVNFSPVQVGGITPQVTVAYSDVISKSETRDLSAFGKKISPVGAFFTNGQKWNDYVTKTSPSGAMDVSTQGGCNAGSPDCVNGGIHRSVSLPGLTDCNQLESIINDSENIFTWACLKEASTVKVYSKGFKAGKGLRDLITATAQWKIPTLSISLFSAGGVVFQSDPAVAWWSNQVVNLSALSATLSTPASTISTANYAGLDASGSPSAANLVTISLTTPSAVYYMNNNITVPGLHIGAPKISVVTLAGATIGSNNGTAVQNCNTSSGTVSSPNSSALICVDQNSDYFWFESVLLNQTPVTFGIYATGMEFMHINKSEVRYGQNGIKLSGSSKNRITSTDVKYAVGVGVDLYYSANLRMKDCKITNGNGLGINIDSGSQNTIEDTLVAKNAGNGMDIYASSGNKFYRFTSVYNDMGIVVNSPNNTFVDLKTAGNDSAGLSIQTAGTNTRVVNFTSVQNYSYGLYVNSMRNTFMNATIMNNGFGIKLDSASYNTMLNIVTGSVSTASSSAAIELDTSHNNLIDGLAAWQGFGNVLLNGSNNNDLFKILTGETTDGVNDCQLSGTTGNEIDGTPVSNGTSASCPGGYPNLALTNEFKGNLFGAQAYTALTPAQLFTPTLSLYQFWGPQTANPITDDSVTGPCASGNCEIFDWRLVATSPLKNISGSGIPGTFNGAFVGGSNCPPQLSGNMKTTNQATSVQTFLTHAYEDVQAPNTMSNGDGLCESNENCIYAPHMGVYQGEGGKTAECNYDHAAGLTDIFIKSYSISTAP